jgi:hypothetical protein
MKRLILGVGAIILSVMYFAEPAAAQSAGDLAGSWEFTIEAVVAADAVVVAGAAACLGGATDARVLR